MVIIPIIMVIIPIIMVIIPIIMVIIPMIVTCCNMIQLNLDGTHRAALLYSETRRESCSRGSASRGTELQLQSGAK